PDLLGNAPEVVHQLVEVACDTRQLGHDVAVGEGVVADTALPDLGGDVPETAQAEANTDGDQQGDDGQHKVDGGGDADLARLPVGPADRGVEEFRGRVGRGQHPAAVGGADRDDRGQELDRAVGLFVADLVGGIPHAGAGKRWRE